MKKVNVIVVPETSDYKLDLYHGCTVFINPNLGHPDLEGRNAKYLAPHWLGEDQPGVHRIFHITGMVGNEIYIGNSFILDSVWNKMGQTRRFAYYPLEDFNFIEIRDGLLLPYSFATI